MAGRYGADQFGRFLSGAALVLLIVNLFVRGVVGQILYFLVLAVLVYNIFRMFSKNTAARYKENVAYLKVKNRVVGWYANLRRRIRESKTHRFYKCPTCKTTVRVPKGKGKINIRCPKCGEKFIKKT